LPLRSCDVAVGKKSESPRLTSPGKEIYVYTVPVVLAIVVVFLAALIFWGAISEQRRGGAG